MQKRTSGQARRTRCQEVCWSLCVQPPKVRVAVCTRLGHAGGRAGWLRLLCACMTPGTHASEQRPLPPPPLPPPPTTHADLKAAFGWAFFAHRAAPGAPWVFDPTPRCVSTLRKGGAKVQGPKCGACKEHHFNWTSTAATSLEAVEAQVDGTVRRDGASKCPWDFQCLFCRQGQYLLPSEVAEAVARCSALDSDRPGGWRRSGWCHAPIPLPPPPHAHGACTCVCGCVCVCPLPSSAQLRPSRGPAGIHRGRPGSASS